MKEMISNCFECGILLEGDFIFCSKKCENKCNHHRMIEESATNRKIVWCHNARFDEETQSSEKDFFEFKDGMTCCPFCGCDIEPHTLEYKHGCISRKMLIEKILKGLPV